MEKVFVYGTLKPGEVNYQIYCANSVAKVVRVYTFGQLFDLPFGYPAMTTGEERVEGFLLSFRGSEILAKLDQLEDYDPERSLPENEYYRQKITVYQPNGKAIGEAWGYLMLPEKVTKLGGVRLPSGRWQGKHWKLDS